MPSRQASLERCFCSPEPMKLLIVADDFTGALDTGTQFSKHGVATALFLYDTMSKKQLASSGADVIVVDTESRHLSANDAALRVYTTATLAKELGCRIFYKKTDSTLRGNIGSELSALQDACQAKQLWFAPAYPALGRTTCNAVHFVNGIPLTQTDYAKDPFNPVQSSYVPDILAEQTDRTVRTVSAGHLLPKQADPELIVVDAQTDSDLQKTVQALSSAGQLTCLAGCAGFAAALEKVLPFPRTRRTLPKNKGGILLVCGSVHQQSVAQCRYAAEHCAYLDRPLTPSQMLSTQDDCNELIQDVCLALHNGLHAIVRVPGGHETLAETSFTADQLSILQEDIPPRIAAKIGQITASIVKTQPISALIVFGGDTLLGIAAALGCVSVTPVEELLPGVVLSRMRTLSADLNLITKAGGFGDETLVRQIEQRLQEIDCWEE